MSVLVCRTVYKHFSFSPRVSGDRTDGSPAAQFAAFTTPVGLERDVRNVQEVSLPCLDIQFIQNM